MFAKGELGRFSFTHNVLVRVVKYWIKLVESDVSRAVRRCYDYQRHLSNTDRPCWATDVKKLLFSFGFGEVWISEGAGNTNVFMSEFITRSKDIDCQNWRACMNSYGNLRTYRNLKSELKMEWYLTISRVCQELHRPPSWWTPQDRC